MKPIRALGRLGMIPNDRRLWIFRSDLGAMSRNRGVDQFARLVVWHKEVLAISDLLVRSLEIQLDLCRRLSKRPADRQLRMEQKRYDKLVSQLLWEHKTALTKYRTAVRLVIRG